MKLLRVIVISFLVFAQARAWGQDAGERRVLLLHLSITDPLLPGQPPMVTASDDLVHWEYKALRDDEKPLPNSIFVRVFHGSKDWLIQQMPKFIKQGCVDYSPALLNVSTKGFKLSFWGLNTQWLSGDSPEVLTLVFESADTGGRSSLRLSPDKESITNYFNSGIEIKLAPPAGFKHVQVISGPAAAKSVSVPAAEVALPPCHTVQNYRNALVEVNTASPLLAASIVMKEVPCGM